MKILKVAKNYEQWFIVFDVIPEITYEKVGRDFVGSACSHGRILESRFLRYENYSDAFAGREIALQMKDGSTEKVKNHWFDLGPYAKHGEFINIGVGTVRDLQKCYVYTSYNINKNIFSNMLDEYFTKDKVYTYKEIEDWVKLQYTWYPMVIHGNKIPFMVNKYGQVAERETKEYIYTRKTILRKVKGKYRKYNIFTLQYTDNIGRLIKIEANYLKTLLATLPYTEEEIRKNCRLEEK